MGDLLHMVDLVLRARVRMAEEKVIGPEDSVVSEMIEELPQEKIHEITKCFPKRFMRQEGAPSSWKLCEISISPGNQLWNQR